MSVAQFEREIMLERPAEGRQGAGRWQVLRGRPRGRVIEAEAILAALAAGQTIPQIAAARHPTRWPALSRGERGATRPVAVFAIARGHHQRPYDWQAAAPRFAAARQITRVVR